MATVLLVEETTDLSQITDKLYLTRIRVRERPFNLKGGVMFSFSKKNILIPNVAEKNILLLVEEKKFI
jgi:hypothetical protein